MSDELQLVHVQIQQVLARYCRGVDRSDASLIESAYWEDAYDRHVIFEGTPKELAQWVVTYLSKDKSSMHILGQSLINLEGDVARVETYFTANHVRLTPEGEVLFVSAGRYLDLFQRRQKSWRILRREVLIDQQRVQAVASIPKYATLVGRPEEVFGLRSKHDRSYYLLSDANVAASQ